MLSELEKEKIRAEEIYRNELRNDLKEKSENNGNVVLRFLDTQHGLFISSMVVLPFLLWFFAFVQNTYAEYNENKKLIEKIDYEMMYRVSNFENRLQSGDVIGFIEDIDRNYVYPEFSGVGVQGLMLQLEGLVGKTDRQQIVLARNSLISKDKTKIEESLRIRGWRK